ncbi:interleukin 4 induced 1 [Homo sapiens]|uniref:Interleukin 4 induced 1 n=1 Tax=Homo sapiens TaxID=9606 RepID=M0QXY7_HUMAN|nr:interleukin 4 induced 1 [Homo sapiens]KAI4044089.1 interleukin 4 induced 1 [Homo sapiens]
MPNDDFCPGLTIKAMGAERAPQRQPCNTISHRESWPHWPCTSSSSSPSSSAWWPPRTGRLNAAKTPSRNACRILTMSSCSRW